MIYLFKKTVFNCQQATLLSLKKADGEASFVERVKLSYHLLYCKVCRRFVMQSARIDEFTSRADKSEPPSLNLSGEAQDRIQRLINELNK